jgi:hypothetical protein
VTVATRDKLGVLLRGCLWSLIVAAALALAVEIVVLISQRSPRNSLVSKMESWGASTVVEAPPGRKLVNAMWKDGDLWILTRPAGEGERLDQAWTLDEYSTWGIFNNHVLLKETSK